MTLKCVIAHIGGGLCNCLGSLIVASYIAKRYNARILFYWQRSIVNDVSYEQLFESIKAVPMDSKSFDAFIDQNLDNMTLVGQDEKDPRWKTINPLFFQKQIFTCENYRSDAVPLSFFDSLNTDYLLITSCTIPIWANGQVLQTFLEYFPIRKCFFQNPPSSVAIHIRGTDWFETFGLTAKDVVPFALAVREKHIDKTICIYTDDEDVRNCLLPYNFMFSTSEFVKRKNNNLTYRHGENNKDDAR